jgi:hypothetical protein
MWRQLLGLADAQTKTALRNIAAPALLILLCAFFALIGLAGLFGALFLRLAATQGPVFAALAVAVAAFILALIALGAILVRGRRKTPPAPAPAPVDLAALLPGLLPGLLPLLKPKQLAIGSALAALLFGLAAMATSSKKDER